VATDFELQVLAELGEIKATAASTAATCTALNERLFNGGSGVITVIQADIDELKTDAKNEVWWDRGKTALGPILVGLHMLLHKFGLKV
jgi:hypothetical protein